LNDWETTVTWARKRINDLLHTNDRAVERAVVVLFELQTRDEQHSSTTKHNNGVGFCGWAARKGSYYARWVLSGRALTGCHLDNARRIALHHSRQLVEAANRRAAA